MSWFIGWIESLFHDLRFGLRLLRKESAVSAAAVLSLALASGACIAAFALIDGLVLRPLPVHDPGRLVSIAYPRWDGSGAEDTFVSYSLLDRLREASAEQLDMLGAGGQGFLRPAVFDDSGGQAENIRAQALSGNAFGVLGVQPALGRVFTPSGDDGLAIVLGYDFWTRRFGRSPSVLGRWVVLNGAQYRIEGVARAGFTGLAPGMLTDAWYTDVMPAGAMGNPEAGWSGAWGRLRPGANPEQARPMLQAAFTNWRRDMVKLFPAGTPQRRIDDFLTARLTLVSAAHGMSYLRGAYARPLWMLAVVVSLVMLIACSNVANLLIARAAAREREMAIRVSIGAGRGRILQQMFVESALIGSTACTLGLLFAAFTAPIVVGLLAPSDNPAYLDLHVDARVVAFTLLISILATVLFGMVPALRAAGVVASGKKTGVLRPLLAAQIAFSFLVLFAAGLLLRSFDKLTSVDLGFSKEGVVLFSLRAREGSPEALRLLDRVRELPGVRSASLSGWGLGGGMTAPVWTPSIRIPGRATEPSGPHYLAVSQGFFETMRIPLIDGHDFTARDTAPENPTAVIVNQTFARHHFPGENPLGKRFERIGGSGSIEQEIAGVVRDAKYNNVRESTPPTVYVPLRGGRTATLEVRTSGDRLASIPGLRAQIERADPLFRVASVISQSKLIGDTLLSERLLAALSAFFGAVAMVLAAVGLYGAIGYAVVRRTREIGIRFALGATRPGIVRTVLAGFAPVVSIGIAMGAIAGLSLGRLVGSLVFEVKPNDPASVLLPVFGLLFTGAIAALRPVLRAALVDPSIALRYH